VSGFFFNTAVYGAGLAYFTPMIADRHYLSQVPAAVSVAVSPTSKPTDEEFQMTARYWIENHTGLGVGPYSSNRPLMQWSWEGVRYTLLDVDSFSEGAVAKAFQKEGLPHEWLTEENPEAQSYFEGGSYKAIQQLSRIVAIAMKETVKRLEENSRFSEKGSYLEMGEGNSERYFPTYVRRVDGMSLSLFADDFYELASGAAFPVMKKSTVVDTDEEIQSESRKAAERLLRQVQSPKGIRFRSFLDFEYDRMEVLLNPYLQEKDFDLHQEHSKEEWIDLLTQILRIEFEALRKNATPSKDGLDYAAGNGRSITIEDVGGLADRLIETSDAEAAKKHVAQIKEEADALVAELNAKRAKVGMGPVQLDQKASFLAQMSAETGRISLRSGMRVGWTGFSPMKFSAKNVAATVSNGQYTLITPSITKVGLGIRGGHWIVIGK